MALAQDRRPDRKQVERLRLLRRRGIALLLPATLLLLACEGTTDPTPALPAILDLGIDASDGPIFRTLNLRLDQEATVEVDYWTAGSVRLRVSGAPAREHEIWLPRLRASSAYSYQVRLVAEDGRRSEPRSGQFSTGTLPPELAALRFAASGRPTTPLVLLVVRLEQGLGGYVVTDASGEIVWYFQEEGPYGITRRSNGNFAFVSDRGLFEVSLAGQVVAQVLGDPVGRRFHHDVITTPVNTLLAIATDTQTVRGTRITGEAIWEWSPETGELRKRWSAFDVLDPFLDRGPRFSEGNWMHANSLFLGARGNVLLSSNYLNQIMSISPDFRTLEWRLGGPNATITVPDTERFTGQHTAAELENGHVLLFDNRREQGVYSRAVEFALEGAEARRMWEWRPARDNFAFAVSSARRQVGGTTLVAFGMSTGLLGSSGPVEVYEVGPAGNVLWRLEASGVAVLYRAEPLADLAGEVVITNP